jgi:hypothetical protein
MSTEEWRTFLETARSDVQERKRNLEETIRGSEGAERDEAQRLLAETERKLSDLEDSLQWQARRAVLPQRLAELLERKQTLQEALRSRGDEGVTNEKQLLANIRQRLPELKRLLGTINEHWGMEDGVYRFYHGSFKVFGLQDLTLKVVDALLGLAPQEFLDSQFLSIVLEGTGKEFAAEMNANWAEATRPILEAFFHARYFLEMVCKYGEQAAELEESLRRLAEIIARRKTEKPPYPLFEGEALSSGWAAVLTLYGLR